MSSAASTSNPSLPPPSRFGETAAGSIIYLLSGKKLLRAPEEKQGYVVPEKYKVGAPTVADERAKEKLSTGQTSPAAVSNHSESGTLNGGAAPAEQPKPADVEKAALAAKEDRAKQPGDQSEEKQGADVGQLHNGGDYTLVTWYSDSDSENPRNWPLPYKIWVTAQICMATTAIYMGSAIISPVTEDLMTDLNCGRTAASLTITLFVWGYGIGPLFLSPMSEIPAIGRTWPYIISIGLFVLLQFPSIYNSSLGALLPLRFAAGFVGSPVLATGGATVGDIWDMESFSIALGLWGLSAASGPALGPLIGGWAGQANGWRWCLWPLLWATGGVWLIMFFQLPETNHSTILSRRAARLRRVTGNQKLTSQGDLEAAGMTLGEVAQMTLVRPFILTFAEPVAFANNLFIAFIYAVLYCFFEVYPLIFAERHGFNPGELGTAFLGIVVGAVIGMGIYSIFVIKYLNPRLRSGEHSPEDRQIIAMVGGICFPISLFWIGWTSFSSIHWIVPILGSGLFGMSVFFLFQGILVYLAQNYPRYVASIFAANDVMRSGLGGAFPLFASQMFSALTVQGGCSLLGGFSLLLTPIPFVLYKYGPRLRAASKWAGMSEDDE
ncbi:Synaptic vesicle transporter SVOP and related transporters (major facilitator superfamily) [Ceraceosorus bombacis]|uniref:Synaptic vesicle transporter SVOP and related transporters (Major facilitator superfamily) n=1 Tax=Ceraceosorus bombacis TaxID=401625 RepID=A0A0P1BDC6_9BASI|nr:Synaptic vesicle transporter SVOP and related transporters (major facilitator superfamily) [Ceraceosorus bombacis]